MLNHIPFCALCGIRITPHALERGCQEYVITFFKSPYFLRTTKSLLDESHDSVLKVILVNDSYKIIFTWLTQRLGLSASASTSPLFLRTTCA